MEKQTWGALVGRIWPEKQHGWGAPIRGARKYHDFNDADVSLCGKQRLGDMPALERDYRPNLDCAACGRKLQELEHKMDTVKLASRLQERAENLKLRTAGQEYD